jgi:pimeloyl-ACP methyl ester carboxylesterase
MRLAARTLLSVLFSLCFLPAAPAAEEWEDVLNQGLTKKHSETRRNALKQVDANSPRGLQAIWNVLDSVAPQNPDLFDWYVREGAYEALSLAESAEAEAEILRVLKAKKFENSKEAIVYSLIWRLRKQFEKDYGENDDRKTEEAKFLLRRKRGVEYFALVLPVVSKVDPKGKKYEWLTIAFEDKAPKVRLAAIQGFLAYPNNASIPLLIENLKSLEKQKTKELKEWVFTRFALETLTGQYHRDDVSNWLKWWDALKERFDIAKRVEEETKEPAEGGASRPKTRVVSTQGVEVTVHMKVAGNPEGYTTLVIPWRGHEPDYFRPYFHGVEEFLRVYYVQMPAIEDFKGLKREDKSGLVYYPTKLLAESLAEIMKDEVLSGDKAVKQFAILGHGQDGCTLAAMMAAQFSGEVSHLILMSPRSAGSEYGEAIQNVSRMGRAKKNWEIETGAKKIQIDREGNPLYKPADSAEEGGLERALDNLHFSDPSSPEIGTLKFLYDLPGGTKLLNDNTWSLKKIFENKKPSVAVMIVRGDKNPWTPASDLSRVEGLFQRPYIARFPNESETPFIGDTSTFTAHVQKFFQQSGVKMSGAKTKGATGGSQ